MHIIAALLIWLAHLRVAANSYEFYAKLLVYRRVPPKLLLQPRWKRFIFVRQRPTAMATLTISTSVRWRSSSSVWRRITTLAWQMITPASKMPPSGLRCNVGEEAHGKKVRGAICWLASIDLRSDRYGRRVRASHAVE